MPTVAQLNLAPTTDLPQVFSCRGAKDLQITISNAGVYLAFAYETMPGIVGGFGIEEFHGMELLVVTGEPIGAVQYRSGKAGTPATITINASS